MNSLFLAALLESAARYEPIHFDLEPIPDRHHDQTRHQDRARQGREVRTAQTRAAQVRTRQAFGIRGTTRETRRTAAATR